MRRRLHAISMAEDLTSSTAPAKSSLWYTAELPLLEEAVDIHDLRPVAGCSRPGGGLIDPSRLISAVVPLDGVGKALEQLADGGPMMKVIVCREPELS